MATELLRLQDDNPWLEFIVVQSSDGLKFTIYDISDGTSKSFHMQDKDQMGLVSAIEDYYPAD